MSKPFFEVFPSLQLNTDIRDLMGQTEVERVSATKRRDLLPGVLKKYPPDPESGHLDHGTGDQEAAVPSGQPDSENIRKVRIVFPVQSGKADGYL